MSNKMTMPHPEHPRGCPGRFHYPGTASSRVAGRRRGDPCPQDAAKLEGQPRDLLAQDRLERVAAALARYRKIRREWSLRASLVKLAASLVVFATVWALRLAALITLLILFSTFLTFAFGLFPETAGIQGTFLLVMFGLVVAFPYLPGGKSPAFQGVSIFIGVLVSLGSQSAMGNVIAGIILTSMRPYQVGDCVKIGDAMGDILERTLLVTRVRTIKNEEIQDSFNEGGAEILSPTYLSLRDGNTVTIPANYRPPDYQPPGFRVEK